MDLEQRRWRIGYEPSILSHFFSDPARLATTKHKLLSSYQIYAAIKMKTTNLAIPLRTSSVAAIDHHRLQLQRSQADLKRKLSEVSFEDEPIPYRKLKIEELELHREEQWVHKSWLDIELEKRHLNENEHRKEHRETNKRIVSLGSELWIEQAALRREEEKEGRAPELGPDSKGAFVHTLLALYKDPNKSNKRSSNSQSRMKKASITVYKAEKGAPSAGKIWCCISQGYFDQCDIRAGHIVPNMLGPELVDYIFGAGPGSRLDTADNCILIHRTVKKAFNNGNFVLIRIDANKKPLLR